jgi:hypothetical protein
MSPEDGSITRRTWNMLRLSGRTAEQLRRNLTAFPSQMSDLV